MELTVNQALQQGIAAHKAGELQEAENLYRVILQTDPEHPDANHNLGVLAVSFGKFQEALPFLKRALEANPKQGQYWLSYIDALIKLGQLDNAKQILQRGKAAGLRGEKVDRLEEKLNSAPNGISQFTDNVSNPSQNQIDSLVDLYSQGKLEEALTQGSILVQQFSNSYVILNILGAIYSGLGQYEEAISTYKKALKLKPDYAEAYNNLGNIFNKIGKNEESILNYREAIKLKPDYTDAYYNLGVILISADKYAEAITNFNRVIEFKPDHSDAFGNLGVAFNKLDRYDDAIVCYKRAIELKPNVAENYNNLGNALSKINDYEKAITNYNKAIELKPDIAEFYNNIGNALTYFRADDYSEKLADNYLRILNLETFIKPSDLVFSIIELLKRHNVIKEFIISIQKNDPNYCVYEFCDRLSKIPLLLRIMELCPIPDLEIEELLKRLRKDFLLQRKQLSTCYNLSQLQNSLASQCFINEFIYQETEEEKKAIENLEEVIKKAFSDKDDLKSFDLACLASYRALHDYHWAKTLVYHASLETLFNRQIIEVNRERTLRVSTPVLKPINDDVSLAVQNQYEENPYPRWINTKLESKPMTLSDIASTAELRLRNDPDQKLDQPNVLIAGCGTGQHSLITASRLKNCHVTAIDLSLSSISYARRKTEELGFKNIDYMQADILDLKLLDKQFDIIESVGVLHHMADPIAGWKVLVDCLKPGGVMRIGLYSAFARSHIQIIRAKIANNALSSNRNDMLQLRNKMINQKYPELNTLKTSPDFYCVSTLRDLLFHVQEHQFTIPQITEILKQLGLIFIGFEFRGNREKEAITTAYGQREAIFDLNKWHDFEILKPRLFSNMYQFWAQKV